MLIWQFFMHVSKMLYFALGPGSTCLWPKRKRENEHGRQEMTSVKLEQMQKVEIFSYKSSVKRREKKIVGPIAYVSLFQTNENNFSLLTSLSHHLLSHSSESLTSSWVSSRILNSKYSFHFFSSFLCFFCYDLLIWFLIGFYNWVLKNFPAEVSLWFGLIFLSNLLHLDCAKN